MGVTVSTDLATTDDWDSSGLEDFEGLRASMPRLSIVHPEGIFRNAQTSENFTVLNGVALGMIRQRAMFHREMGKEKLKPQCKSSDSITGYPTMAGNTKDLFPWSEVSFKAMDLPVDEWKRPQIACKSCPMAEWTDKRTPPRCAERHAYPILFSDDPNWAPGDPMPHRGIVSFQKSGIKPSGLFLNFFKSARLPVYSHHVKIVLRRETVGMVTYSIPIFQRLAATPEAAWPEYSGDLKAVREFLRQPPRPPEDEEGDSKSASATAATSVIDSSAAMASSTPPAATWGDDDDLPF